MLGKQQSKSFALRAGIIVTKFLADLAVTTAKLANLAVTDGKIANNTISYGKLNADAKERTIKAWVKYDQTVPVVRDSYNVASVTDVGLGDHTVVWDTDFATINYAVWGDVGYTQFGMNCVKMGVAPLVGSARRQTISYAGSGFDEPHISIAAIGDQ